MPGRWNEETTCKFVLLYKEHECLWNMHSEMYRNKQARQTALSDICAKMDIDNFEIQDVKQKIKSLRSTYQLEQIKVQKSEQSGASIEDVYKPALKWFQLMNDVMKQGVMKRASMNNLDTPADIQEEEDLSTDIDRGDFAKHPPKSENIKRAPIPKVSNPKTSSRKRMNDVTIAIKELRELNKSLNSPEHTDDDCGIFGKYVALRLRKLQPHKCIMAQDDIQRILTKYQLEELSYNTSDLSPP